MSNTCAINYSVPISLSFDTDLFIHYVCDSLAITNSFFEFTFVSVSTICDMHRVQLNDPSETDIITFNLTETPVSTSNGLIGDIYICPDIANQHACELNHSLDIEIQTLITHGILHIVGYDDQSVADKKLMFDKQDHLVANYQ